jgi:hypothetical protein
VGIGHAPGSRADVPFRRGEPGHRCRGPRARSGRGRMLPPAACSLVCWRWWVS